MLTNTPSGHADCVLRATDFKPAPGPAANHDWMRWQIASSWWDRLTPAQQIEIFNERGAH